MLKTIFLTAGILLWTVVETAAAVELGRPFTSGAVLQRGVKAPVWGKASPGETVTVSFNGQRHEVSAGAEGFWRVDLDPMEASAVPQTLTAAGSGGTSAAANDVLVGEVWFAGGQSNMDFRLVGGSARGHARLGAARAQFTRRPSVRIAMAGSTGRLVWRHAVPEEMLKPRAVGAIAYFFGCDLNEALGVPVGVMQAAVGGTPIEPWIADAGWAAVPQLEKRASGENPKPIQLPGALFKRLIAPNVPYAVKGVIWYQGCSNAARAQNYRFKMKALLEGFASAFGNPSLPIRFVQIAPYRGRTPETHRNTLSLQLEQAAFAAMEPRAKMAVIADSDQYEEIHPEEKAEVALKLALLALRHDYGLDVKADAPEAVTATAANGRVAVKFANADRLYLYSRKKDMSADFEVADASGAWHAAKVVNLVVGPNRFGKPDRTGDFAGNIVELEVEGAVDPKRVRYLGNEPHFSPLRNEAGLCAGPFDIVVDR